MVRYRSERASDQSKKVNLKDLISKENFEKLVKSMKGKEETQKVKDAYMRLTSGGDTKTLLGLKQFAKMGLSFDPTLDIHIQLAHCQFFAAARNEESDECLEELVKNLQKPISTGVNIRNLNGDTVLLDTLKIGNGEVKRVLSLSNPQREIISNLSHYLRDFGLQIRVFVTLKFKNFVETHILSPALTIICQYHQRKQNENSKSHKLCNENS